MTLQTTAPAGVLTAVFAAAALAGCATFSGTVDDEGRVFREATEAPLDANLEPLAGEASIQLFNDRLPQLGGRTRNAGGEPASACDAERWQTLLGMAEPRVRSQSLPETVRVIPFGAMVTQDYLPNRLNVYLDQNDRVYRVICG